MRRLLFIPLLCGLAFGQGAVVKGPAVIKGPSVMSPGTAAATGNPGTISPSNLKVWYRGDSLTCTGGCSGTNVVTSLNDKSGNANNCTTTNSPTFLANFGNSQPGVTWNGTNQSCALGSTIPWNGTTNGITIFAVIKPAADSNFRAIASGNNSSFIYYLLGSTNQQRTDLIGTGNIEIGTGTWTSTNACFVTTWNSSTGASAFYEGGAADGTATTTGTVLNGTSNLFIDFGDGSIRNYSGPWAEIAIWDTVIATSDITTTLHNYCTSQYGLS